MAISVTRSGTNGPLIGGNSSPVYTVPVPLPSLAAGDVLVVFGWGQTQAQSSDDNTVHVRSGHEAGTLDNTGWSIDGSGWNPIVDEIGDVSSGGRRPRLFALWRLCDGTETGFTVTGDGWLKGWSNSTASGGGLRVGSLRLRSDTSTTIVVAADPVVSTIGVNTDDWQPDPTAAVPRDSLGLGLASWGQVIPFDSTGWATWNTGMGLAPRGGHWSAQVDSGDPATPPTADISPGGGGLALVAALAFSDRPAPPESRLWTGPSVIGFGGGLT